MKLCISQAEARDLVRKTILESPKKAVSIRFEDVLHKWNQKQFSKPANGYLKTKKK